jgi:hypothetical protein
MLRFDSRISFEGLIRVIQKGLGGVIRMTFLRVFQTGAVNPVIGAPLLIERKNPGFCYQSIKTTFKPGRDLIVLGLLMDFLRVHQ